MHETVTSSMQLASGRRTPPLPSTGAGQGEGVPTVLLEGPHEMSATLYPEHRFLHLSLAVATAANEADRLEEAFQAAVDQVCTVMDWPVGHVYLATDAGELVACDVWHLAD